MAQRSKRFYLALFTFSGLAGLIYESIWTQYLKLFLGHAAYAQTLVLAIFMGGMAIGSGICSKYSAKWSNLLKIYALIEAAIGLFGMAFHPVFDFVTHWSFSAAIPCLTSPLAINGLKWTIASLLILPQSILLGMTFPLMSGAMLRLFPGRPGRSLSLLYFTNSFGAAAGVLLCGYVFVPAAGLPGAILLAAMINLVIAAVVMVFAGRSVLVEQRFAIIAPGEHASSRLLLAASLITGASSFLYEIGWIRMLSLVLGSSTHAFELMLSAFIAGLALGGFWIKGRMDGLNQPVRAFAAVQLIMGFLALLTLPAYNASFDLMRWLLSALNRNDAGYILFTAGSQSIALLVMLPTTFCAGMTLPLLTYILLQRGQGERAIGAVYGWNTLGAILGIGLGIAFVLPLWGLKGVISLGAAMDITLGLLVLHVLTSHRNVRHTVSLSAASAASAVLFLAFIFFTDLDPYKMASGIFRTGNLMSAKDCEVLFRRDGRTSTVSVIKTSGGISISTNGKPDASISLTDTPSVDEYTQILTAAIPLAVHPAAKNAAVIGFGSGFTSHTLLSYAGLERVDTIEIEPAMVEGSRLFGSVAELAYTDPRGHVFFEDAKTFFPSQNRQYDIIVSEPSNPWVSGVAGLFSVEFYRSVKPYIRRGGVYAQWIHTYEIDLPLLASIFKAVSQEFGNFELYAMDDDDMLIVCRPEGRFQELDGALFSHPRLAAILSRINIRAIQDIAIRRIGGKKELMPLFDSFSVGPNSDYYPFVDLSAERTRFLYLNAAELITLPNLPFPLAEWVLEEPGREKSSHFDRVSSSNFRRSTLMLKSRILGKYLTTNNFPAGPSVVSTEARRDAVDFRNNFFRCAGPDGRDRIDTLFSTGIRVFPYLTAGEARSVWQNLETRSCAPVISELEKSWIALFKAIGRRDAESMARESTDVLRQMIAVGRLEKKDQLSYALAVGMLARIHLKRKAEAQQLYDQNRDLAFGSTAPPLVFRYLSSIARN